MRLSEFELNQLEHQILPPFIKDWEKRLNKRRPVNGIICTLNHEKALVMISISYRVNSRSGALIAYTDRLVVHCRHDVNTTILDCNRLLLQVLDQ